MNQLIAKRVTMTARTAFAFVALGAALLLSAIGIALFVQDGGDPLDRFEIIRITSEQGSKRHAVTYLYHHANSSSLVIGTWLTSGAPPAIKSNDRPNGRLAFLWTGKPDDLRLRWSHGRFEAAADGIQIRTDKFNDCYFKAEGKRMLCADPNTTTLVD